MKLKGFTLAELLAIVTIIGLLAAAGVFLYINSAKKARDAQRRTDLIVIKSALETYFQDNAAYPSTGGNWWGNCTGYGSHPTSGASAYVPSLTPTYLAVLPTDPHPAAQPQLNAACSASQACYLYRSDGNGYKLLAHCDMEYSIPNSSDPMDDPSRPSWAIMLCSDPTACAW